MEVLLLLLPQAHPIDDLGEYLEKRLAVWPQEPVLSPTSVTEWQTVSISYPVKLLNYSSMTSVLVLVCPASSNVLVVMGWSMLTCQRPFQ